MSRLRFVITLAALFLTIFIHVLIGSTSFAQTTGARTSSPALAATATPAEVSEGSDRDTPSCTLRLTIDGAVTPATLDYLERGMKRASELDCRSILLVINTPGGGLPTTRLIVEKILASPIPVLCLVGPPGGHAGSAGAIILMSCHVNGAEPATNIGAATPVSGSGEAISEDLRKKVVEDTVSWTRGLAKLRGRNVEFAEKIVTEAKAVDAEEAVKIGAVDILATDPARFLDLAEGRVVKLAGDATTPVRTGAITEFEPDLRNRFLQFVTDPQMAYLIFMASIALLYFEITNPGFGVPGIAGAIGLIVSLVSFHQLDVWWGGVFLIVLGLALLIAEAFVVSFGALGIGGIVALVAGSLFLFDPGTTGVSLPYMYIAATAGTIGVFVFGIAIFALRSRRGVHPNDIEKAIVGKFGEVMSLEAPSLRRGMLRVDGEFWRFLSDRDVQVGDTVQVVSQEALVLQVRAVPKGAEPK